MKSEITAFKLVSWKCSWKDRILTIVCMVSGVQFFKKKTDSRKWTFIWFKADGLLSRAPKNEYDVINLYSLQDRTELVWVQLWLTNTCGLRRSIYQQRLAKKWTQKTTLLGFLSDFSVGQSTHDTNFLSKTNWTVTNTTVVCYNDSRWQIEMKRKKCLYLTTFRYTLLAIFYLLY